MHTYTVVRSNTGGRPLTGSATRRYLVPNAVAAGRLYAAAEGIPAPILHGQRVTADAAIFTFRPDAEHGARITVRVEVA